MSDTSQDNEDQQHANIAADLTETHAKKQEKLANSDLYKWEKKNQTLGHSPEATLHRLTDSGEIFYHDENGALDRIEFARLQKSTTGKRNRVEEEENTFLTHTFSECVENHAGMQTLGCKRDFGLSEKYVAGIAAKFPDLCTLHQLEMNGEHASVVVFHGGVDFLLGKCGADKLMKESKDQPFDSQFLNVKRKIVQNKHGRLNNCYSDLSQEPNIPEGKGTVIAFGCAPKISELRDKIPHLTGIETKGLYAETNQYVDVRKRQVGIGFHGDSERSIVVGVRLGEASMPLRFQWYNRSKPISDEYVIDLKHGDMYCMSWKATGHDWKCSSKTTLRHGVGRKAVTRKIGQ